MQAHRPASKKLHYTTIESLATCGAFFIAIELVFVKFEKMKYHPVPQRELNDGKKSVMISRGF
jgi:hypothetical protein